MNPDLVGCREATAPTARRSRGSLLRAAAGLLFLLGAAGCIAAAGYHWGKKRVLDQHAADAVTTLERSHDQEELKGAALVIAERAINLLTALKATRDSGGPAAEDCRIYLERIASFVRQPSPPKEKK